MLQLFDRSLHATHVWLDDIGDYLGPNDQRSYHALKAVLHALRDNLPVEQSANMAAQLPMIVRGIYFAEWQPDSNGKKARTRDKFIESVGENLNSISPIDPEEACHAVFQTLNYHIEPGELKKARASLTKSVQALWPELEGDGMEKESDNDEAEGNTMSAANGKNILKKTPTRKTARKQTGKAASNGRARKKKG